MTTTDTMRHLAAIGSPSAVAVFVWVHAAGLPVRQEWLEAMTGISDKTIKPALERLANLEYIAKASGGWIVAPGRQGVLGDFIAALAPAAPQLSEPPPAIEQDGNSVSVGQHTDDDDGNAPAGLEENTEFPSALYGGGVGLTALTDLKQTESKAVKQHHQHGAEDGNSVSAEDARRVEALLARLGCWDSRIGKIVPGLHPTRGLGIVLGWIAYAHDPDNELRRPAAVIAGHLSKGLAPASKWVPPRICCACHLAEGLCACGEPTSFHYPPDFDDLAFEAPPAHDTAAWVANRWRCDLCGGHPCQCEELEKDS